MNGTFRYCQAEMPRARISPLNVEVPLEELLISPLVLIPFTVSVPVAMRFAAEMSPETISLPCIERFVEGEVVPMPTLPPTLMLPANMDVAVVDVASIDATDGVVVGETFPDESMAKRTFEPTCRFVGPVTLSDPGPTFKAFMLAMPPTVIFPPNVELPDIAKDEPLKFAALFVIILATVWATAKPPAAKTSLLDWPDMNVYVGVHGTNPFIAAAMRASTSAKVSCLERDAMMATALVPDDGDGTTTFVASDEGTVVDAAR